MGRRLVKELLVENMFFCGCCVFVWDSLVFFLFPFCCSGTLSFAEFCDGIRGTLSEKRMTMVNKAFHSVEDPIGSGETTFETLESEVNNDQSDVLDALEKMLDEKGGDSGVITEAEFVDYYRTLSASVDGDRKFEAILTSTYPNGDMKPAPVVPVKRSSRNSRNTTSRNRSSANRGSGARGGTSSGNRGNSGGRRKEEDALARFRKSKKRPDLANRSNMIRLKAANHLQAVFRGHKGRVKVDYERRKKEQKAVQDMQDKKEKDMHDKRVRRTQPKHNPRFQAARR